MQLKTEQKLRSLLNIIIIICWLIDNLPSPSFLSSSISLCLWIGFVSFTPYPLPRKLVTTSASAADPYRPFILHLVNFIWNLIPIRASLNPEALLQKAIGVANLPKGAVPSFGQTLQYAPGLHALCDSYKQGEAKFHPFGQFMEQQRIVNMLANRVRAQYLFQQHPEILTCSRFSLHAPIVITGLPRTGSTRLQRLLSCDPRLRSLLSWETFNPAPFLTSDGKPILASSSSSSPASSPASFVAVDPRVAKAQTSISALYFFTPQFFAIHPCEVDQQEEECMLMDLSFNTEVVTSMHDVPSYDQWLKQQSPESAYQTLQDFLKLLNWQSSLTDNDTGKEAKNSKSNSPRRWILKTPSHLEHIQSLFQAFPDAKVIMTHRDPSKVTPSFASMIAHCKSLMSDQVDLKSTGQYWMNKHADEVNNMMQYRASLDVKEVQEKFLDVQYDECMKDPIAQVRRIYEFVDLELTDDIIQRMKNQLVNKSQHRYGVHKYDAADFGINTEMMKDKFGEYVETFNVPCKW